MWKMVKDGEVSFLEMIHSDESFFCPKTSEKNIEVSSPVSVAGGKMIQFDMGFQLGLKRII